MSEPSIGTATVPASSAQLHRASAWIYSGVWAALTGLFLVPREPPTMPEGSHEIIGTFRPSANYLKYIKVFFWISLFSFNIPIWIGWIGITIAAPIVGIILAVLAIGLLSVQGVFGYIGIHLRYDSTWYVLTDRPCGFAAACSTSQKPPSPMRMYKTSRSSRDRCNGFSGLPMSQYSRPVAAGIITAARATGVITSAALKG